MAASHNRLATLFEPCPICHVPRWIQPSRRHRKCKNCHNRSISKKGTESNLFKHGGRNTSEYISWQAMKARCLNPNNLWYSHYGGRGITVCDRWLHFFENFLEDMGPKPEPKRLYSIDRFPNNDGNYEPDNCRWATKSEQASNRRKRFVS